MLLSEIFEFEYRAFPSPFTVLTLAPLRENFWLLAISCGWSRGGASSVLSVSPGNRDTKSF